MRKCFLAVAALAALSGSAFAGDLPSTKEAPVFMAPAPNFSWAGAYGGLDVGGSWGSARHSFNNGAPGGNSNPQGVIGGGYVGYNIQVDHIVFGFEADGQGSGVKGSYSNSTGGTSVGSTKLNWEAAARGRVGYAIDDKLFYAAGGLTLAGFNYQGGPFPPPACCGFGMTQTGVTIGAGVEFALSNNWIGRVEYRYNDFFATSGSLPPTYPGVIMAVSNNHYSEVRAGIEYKFGALELPAPVFAKY
jgi:outer membrane immunogenic protein